MCLNTVDAKTLSVDRMYKVATAANEDGEYGTLFRSSRFKIGVTSHDDADGYIGGDWKRPFFCPPYRTGYHGWLHLSDALDDRQEGEVVLECAVSDVVASGMQGLVYSNQESQWGPIRQAPCVVARTITLLREIGEGDV